jgi:hypothetical protein
VKSLPAFNQGETVDLKIELYSPFFEGLEVAGLIHQG